jgi:glycosyltransferase involved in cell wall biosynthesis
LVVVGDGPYLKEMKNELKGWPATFTGYLRGEELAQAYASADLFVFPSTTDTFGNVVLEAQASGLPVIVTNQGGPRENMVPERTGVVVPGDDQGAMSRAICRLAGDLEGLQAMSRAARRHMESRSFAAAFDQHWGMYAQDAAGFEATRPRTTVLAA